MGLAPGREHGLEAGPVRSAIPGSVGPAEGAGVAVVVNRVEVPFGRERSGIVQAVGVVSGRKLPDDARLVQVQGSVGRQTRAGRAAEIVPRIVMNAIEIEAEAFPVAGELWFAGPDGGQCAGPVGV